MLTKNDLDILARKGIEESRITEQLDRFKAGFPFLKIQSAATVNNGILALDSLEATKYLDVWETYLKGSHKIVKFVPASGAASRMFKNLFEFLDAPYNTPETDFEKKFFQHIHSFAFFRDLDKTCLKNEGKTINQLLSEGNFKAIVSNLLSEKGLDYGALPKGLLKFHSYEGDARTAMEEHLAEGALYARNAQGDVCVHFTVSTEHRALFETLVKAQIPVFEKIYGVKYHISFSEQKPSTDTIAADMENQPFRDKDNLVFRPGGHGALIENLNDIDADIIFVKNIDNIVPDRLKDETVHYKKIIGGALVSLQQQINAYIKKIESGNYSMDDLREIIYFLQKKLFIKNPDTRLLEDSELAVYLLGKLKRPIRVCGMVKNVGEPGGGPFLAYNQDGTYSPQILESSQIDMNDEAAKTMFGEATHFNPVDLVCAVKDADGHKYDLTRYVDQNTGFISLKSKGGKELKALELPGLWNGAMSDWNTLFVEVPISTFNPVKTVNDLLRDEHQ